MGNIVFLGVEGSGKTSLTTAIVRYFQDHEEWGWSLRPENKEAFAFATRMTKRFAEGEMPAQTARSRRLEWSLCYNDEPQRTVNVLDYPGEIYRLAFLDPDDEPNPAALKAKQQAHASEIAELLGFLRNAEEIRVLFNIDDSKNLATSDENMDAVWVTIQSLRILSALEQKPKLTLLVTQADRLEAEGEDVSDGEAILKKHVPLICQRFKHIEKRLVSSLCPEDARYGLYSLVKDIAAGCGLYKTFLTHCQECRQKIKDGVASQQDCEKLRPSARAFAWIKDLEGAGLLATDVLTRYCEVAGKCQAIATECDSDKKRLVKLTELLNGLDDELERGVVNKRISEVKDEIATDCVFLELCIVIFVVAVAVICVGVLISAR